MAHGPRAARAVPVAQAASSLSDLSWFFELWWPWQSIGKEKQVSSTQFAQGGAFAHLSLLVYPIITAIRLMFHAIVTSVHSPRTESNPRSRNCRKRIADLMMPNTGSTVCLRKP